MKLKSVKEMEDGASMQAGTSSHNKTGNWKTFKPITDFKRCIQCMFCVLDCPDICIPVKDEKRLETNFEMCKGCGVCEQVCPVKCITMVKDD